MMLGGADTAPLNITLKNLRDLREHKIPKIPERGAAG
jgi:hypothetical protein